MLTCCTGNYAVRKSEITTAAAAGPSIPYPVATIRRLSNTQIVNSIQDVFMGGTPLDANLLPLTRVRDGFDDQDALLAVNTPWMTNIQQASEQASSYVAAHAATLAGCDITQPACARAYILKIGRQALRRPLSADEVTQYTKLVTTPPAGTDAPTALSQVVEAMIQSPFFLYRSELGLPATKGNTVQPLAPYETATAIAYFVLNSAPDDALLDAAANNELATPEQRAAQVVRLMHTPRAEAGMWNFMRQWANIGTEAALSGTFSANPNFTAAVAAAAVQQTRLGFAQEIFAGDGAWKNLLLSESAYVNPTLASVDLSGASGASSGAPKAATDPNFVWTPLDPSRYTGFLTQTAFLASQSDPNGFSPIHFGFYVATGLFCSTIPPPPANIPELPADATGVATPRQRFAAHLSNPACASCHMHFQPMGFAFEQYQPIGSFVPTFNGTTLTGQGNVAGTDVDGDFIGARGLAEKIVASDQAKACFTAKMYEYALGHTEATTSQRSAVDQASIATSAAAFANSNTNIQALMVSIVQSDAFMMRDTSRVPPENQP